MHRIAFSKLIVWGGSHRADTTYAYCFINTAIFPLFLCFLLFPSPHHPPLPSPLSQLCSAMELESSATAAAKIQAAYRSHVVRGLVKKISSVRLETERLQRLIQRQETVDAIRSDQRERLRINEELMRQLLALDSVPGFDPAVRELRRNLSRRIVGLQEIVDGICSNKAMEMGTNWWDGELGGGWRNWDEVLEEMEVELCRERGGDELERFCAEQLGFRCFQRFLREP